MLEIHRKRNEGNKIIKEKYEKKTIVKRWKSCRAKVKKKNERKIVNEQMKNYVNAHVC